MHSITRILLVASAVVASVSAGNGHGHGHHHLHEKESAPVSIAEYSAPPVEQAPANATNCGCTTYTTYWYGEGALVQDTPTPTPSPSPVTTITTTSSVYVAPTTSSTSSKPPPAPSTYVAPKPSYVAPPPSPPSQNTPPAPHPPQQGPPHEGGQQHGPPNTGGSGSSSITPNGNQWAMTYTPYDNSGNCKSAQEVTNDINTIHAKGFTTVRLYATDCSAPQNVGAACAANGMKMILGIYIDSAGIGDKTEEQIGTLCTWGAQSNHWSMVEMVVAGNEAIFNGYCSADQMAGFLDHVKQRFRAAGYQGPITTTEPLGTIQQNKDTICPHVDVIAANIHPFFNKDVSAQNAGTFVASSMDDLSACCGHTKDAYNLETGWPSQSSLGIPNGLAIPGISDQRTAIEEIMKHAGSKSAIFSYENDGWKAPGALGVEQFWGCANLFSG